MLKAAGAALIMAGSTALGFSKRMTLSRRLDNLRRLRWEAASLRSKIYGRGISLEEAFAESEFFAPAAKALERGVPVREAVLPLGQGAEGFELFAKGLEADTFEGQIRNIDVFLSELEGGIARAEDDLKRRGRLYLGGGALAGAAAVIMLM